MLNAVNFWQAKLPQAPISNIADIALNVFGRHPFYGSHFKGQVDKLIFHLHNSFAAIYNIISNGLSDASRFLCKCMIKLDHTLTMQALVPDRPGHNLPHAFHLIQTREIHQHGKRGKELQPFRKAAKHRDCAGNIRLGVNAKLLHIIMLIGHGFIFHKGRKLTIGHADCFEQ